MESKFAATMIKDIFRRYDPTGEGCISEEDLVTLLGILGLAEDAGCLLREVTKASNGKLLYRDFIDKVFEVPTEEVSVFVAAPGDEVSVPLSSQEGTVLNRTTTEVQMKMQDGNEVWFDIEDIDCGPVTIHEVNTGGKATLRGGPRYVIVDRTTASVKLRYPDGKEVWHEVEDLEEEAGQASYDLGVGVVARVVPKTIRARVKDRTTTDALVVFSNGVEVWRGIDDLAPTAVGPSAEAERRLREIFDKVDTGKDSHINKRELIKICRADSSIADFFGLSPKIRQEDGSRDDMERLFQAIDSDSDRQLSWAEFRSFFLECMSGRSAASVRTQSSSAALTNG